MHSVLSRLTTLLTLLSSNLKGVNCKVILKLIYFQLKYKRRVYKMLHLDEKQLKAVNSKASRKKFADHVANNNVDKVNKMCAKGLDPNFHCQDSHSGGRTILIIYLSLDNMKVSFYLLFPISLPENYGHP